MTTELARWTDPGTGAVSCEIDQPAGKSADNLVLFASEAVAHGLLTLEEFEAVVEKFESQPGCLVRYPGLKDYTSFDDYVGACSVSWHFAMRALRFFELSNWDTLDGSPLWRFAIFIPIVRAGAAMPLTFMHQCMATCAYLWNAATERTGQTSGRYLLWMASRKLNEYLMIRIAINIWKWCMMLRYPGGMKEMSHIYFPDKNGVPHPFPLAARNDFNP